MNYDKSIIGIDLGGTKILIGEVDINGNVISQKSYPSNVSSQRDAIDTIKKSYEDYKTNIGFKADKQIAVGLGLVGRVDNKSGIWYEIQPSKSEKINIEDIISEFTGLPVGIENDVVCATMAEKEYGHGVEENDFIYLNIGTGIAAGVVENGNIVYGGSFNAGEIGHSVVDINSKVRCLCGRYGCVERVASGLGLSEQIHMRKNEFAQTIINIKEGEVISAKEIFDAHKKGDTLAVEVVEYAAKSIANLIMNLVRTSDPKLFVLGGGVVLNDDFFENIKGYLNNNTIRFVKKGINRSKLDGKLIGLVGASVIGKIKYDILSKEYK